MLIVVGEAVGTRETIAELRRISLDHVHRSRKEDGCIEHAVHFDCEDELRLFFLERWRDLDALKAHFAVAESRIFAQELTKLSTRKPRMTVYRSEEVK